MRKALQLLLLLTFAQVAFAQTAVHSDTLLVTGKVKKEKVITISNLSEYKTVELGNVNTSCSSKRQEESVNVKAVLVKDLLESVEFDYEFPKMLNQFYFRFEGVDGYAVVYSFNEIYNTETGNHMYIVTEMNGKSISEAENRILLLTTNDIKTGNRNIKWLSRIVVCESK